MPILTPLPTKSALALTLSTALVAASFLGCGLLKKKGADGLDGGDGTAMGDAATVTVSGTGAKNEADILRYANETALANEPAVIGKDGTVARTFPGNGPEVATLAKGTAVAKIAQYFSTATLVMFDDTLGDGSKLLGWVPPAAFDVAAPPPLKPVVVPVRSSVDAGAKDASATVALSGGDAGARRDAGAMTTSTAPTPPRGAASASPIEGKCPWDGWVYFGGVCRPRCVTDAECPKPLKCTPRPRMPGKLCMAP